MTAHIERGSRNSAALATSEVATSCGSHLARACPTTGATRLTRPPSASESCYHDNHPLPHRPCCPRTHDHHTRLEVYQAFASCWPRSAGIDRPIVAPDTFVACHASVAAPSAMSQIRSQGLQEL